MGLLGSTAVGLVVWDVVVSCLKGWWCGRQVGWWAGGVVGWWAGGVAARPRELAGPSGGPDINHESSNRHSFDRGAARPG